VVPSLSTLEDMHESLRFDGARNAAGLHVVSVRSIVHRAGHQSQRSPGEDVVDASKRENNLPYLRTEMRSSLRLWSFPTVA
jgi:hypothetical protein